MSKRRVVISGLGVVSPIGVGIEEFSKGLVEPRNGIDYIKGDLDVTDLPVKFAGQVKDFDAISFLGRKEARHLDPFVHFALHSAQQAVDDSQLDVEAERERIGCIWASGIGGLEEIESQHRVALTKGPRRINPFFIPKLMINAGAGQIAIRFGIQGPNYAVVSACASGKHALGLAMRTIQYGDAEVMICGGSEASITMLGLGGFSALKALSERNDDPTTASRPFNIDRDGFVIGEGGAALIVEEYEHARRRGAKIYAEVLGFGMGDDGHHISAPVADGTMAAKTMQRAIAEAGLTPENVEYVNAHGTSTPLNDVMETRAIHHVFGEHARKLAVSSTKSQVGHLLGASGALESVVLALAIEKQFVPPTINYLNPDPECDLDYVPNEGREMEVNVGISNSFGFGGHNASIVIGRCR